MTWTITIKATVFASDEMTREEVIATGDSTLERLLDGTDFCGVSVIDAEKDE